MKKVITIAILVFAACTKDPNSVSASQEASDISLGALIPTVKITEMCYQDSGYMVEMYLNQVTKRDKVFGGCTKGNDTLSKVSLQPINGWTTFFASSKGQGCNVRPYVIVRKRYGIVKSTSATGNCVTCQ